MANVSKTVEIIFGGKDDLSKVVDQVGRKFTDLESMTSKLTGPLAEIAESILKADAALAALAIGGMALAIKESAEFNKSFALISTSVTATGSDLEKYKQDILGYSTTSVKSLADINAALYTAAQAGIKYTDSLAFIRASEQLSVANNANLNTTVDLLTGTMNAYGLTIKDVGRLNDVYFTSTLIGKQTIDELGQSMGNVVGIAANSGVSFEELSAAIATLTAKGLQTPEAITAVKGVITTIIAPSKEAADAAKELGLNFSLTELSSKGLAAMLTEIMAKTGGSKEKMVGLFNEMRAMNGVLSLTGDGMKFFNNSLTEIMNSTGSAEKAYQKMVETFSNQMQTVLNVAKVTMIEVGTKLEPTASSIAGAFGSLLAGVKVGVDQGAFDPLFQYLETVGGQLATWLSEVAKAFPDALKEVKFDGLIEAFNNLGNAIGGYLGGLDLTKASDLASAMQLLIDIVTGLLNVTAGMADAFRPFIIQIVEFFKTMAAGGPEAQETIGKVVGFALAIEKAGLLLVATIITIDEFGISMKSLFNIIAGGTTVMWNGFEILLTAIKGAFLIIEGVIVEFLDSLSFGLIPGLSRMKEVIAEQGAQIGTSFAKNGAEAKVGLDQMMLGLSQLGTETGNSSAKAVELRARFKEIPSETTPTIKLIGAPEAIAHVDAIKTKVEVLPKQTDLKIGVQEDGSSIERVGNIIKTTFPDGEIRYSNVVVKTDADKLKAEKKKIDDAIPGIKVMEIQAKLDDTKIKETSAIIQKSIEWKAKVDIAEAEASTKKLATMFEGVNLGIKSTETMLTSLFGMLNSAGSFSTLIAIQDQIARENKLREDSFKLQKSLVEAEIKLTEAKAKKIDSGTSLIQVQAAGLAPHLEMILWEVLSAIQIRANEAGSEFLLGVR